MVLSLACSINIHLQQQEKVAFIQFLFSWEDGLGVGEAIKSLMFSWRREQKVA